jgi:hypothetical protein
MSDKPATSSTSSDRKHDGALAEQAATAAGHQFGLTQGGMSQAKEVANLVKDNGLDIEPLCVAGLRDGPIERRVQKDVRFNDFTGLGIERECRRAQRPIEIGTGSKTDDRHPVAHKRLSPGEAHEL